MTELRKSDSGFAEVNGTKLCYEIAGTGHPLVLLHAGGLDSWMWDDQFSVFVQHYRVILYDMRGFGKSSPGDVPFSFHQDLYDLLEHLHIERTYVLGLSRGATIAIDFTLAYPEIVDALILVASRAGCSKPSEIIHKIWAESDALAERGMIAEAVEMELRFWVDGLKRTPHQVNPKVRERVREMSAHNYAIPQGIDSRCCSHGKYGKARRIQQNRAQFLKEANTLIFLWLNRSHLFKRGSLTRNVYSRQRLLDSVECFHLL